MSQRNGLILIVLILSGLACLAGLSAAPAAEFENPKVKPPRAKPHRRSAAESLPPLPLPATPLRRSERKRQPAPPAFVGMMKLGVSGFKIRSGKRVKISQFPTTQVDIENLTRHANNKLKIRYRYMPTSLSKFSWDPTELPLLYITGWTPMPELPDDTIAKLRRYLYDGGTLVLHAQCGRGEFTNSAVKNIAKLFPKRQLVNLDTDSPLFSAYFRITKMRVRRNAESIKSIPPILKAVYLGCRPAVILSDIDLNCSWDVVKKPIDGGTLYHKDDGLALGVNIITTTLANFQYARAWGRQKQYPEQAKASRDQLVLAQIIHSGDWDPTPHALPNLMKYIQNQTTLNVQFKRQTIRLDDLDVFKHPVLYMTGLRDFKLTKQEVQRLRTYLTSGGILIADAAVGKKAFDVAFRRELKRVLPKAGLKPIALGAAVYQMPYKIRTVDYAETLKSSNPRLNTPTLEGITIDGQLGVIYSPVGLAAGWEQLGFAYNRGYSDTDALRLGVNIFAYALTH
ncbi:MAG: DUF4159 domain-containing protein [Phycisphaerae bacterium]|nr:DUF4159 domain-containing protein [Phycisphaerae bacterium]